MPNADPEIVKTLDRIAQERFYLEASKQGYEAALKAQQAELQKQYSDQLAPIETQIKRLDGEIWDIVHENRSSLIAEGKKSFAIATATFQFRELKAKIVLADSEGILNVARRYSLIRDIADPPSRKWRLNKQRFLSWLESHAHMRPKFAMYLEETGGGESLTIKPNIGHVVFHDLARLTPISLTITKS